MEALSLYKGALSFPSPVPRTQYKKCPWTCNIVEGKEGHPVPVDESSRLSMEVTHISVFFLATLWNSQLPFSLDEVVLCTKVVPFRAWAQERLTQKPPNANFNICCKQDVKVIVLKSHLPTEKNSLDGSVLFFLSHNILTSFSNWPGNCYFICSNFFCELLFFCK